MAIKAQCEQCRKYNKTCFELIDFDGTSCNQYDKCIDLEKRIVYPNPYVGIHGWLLFFLFVIAVDGLHNAIYPILTYNVAEYDGNHFLAIIDVTVGIMLLLLACYTIFSFYKRKPNAVFLAKMYVCLLFTLNVLILLGGKYDSDLGGLPALVWHLIWDIIWFFYLSFSEQVQDIIPKSYRKVFSRDYYFMATFIIMPILFFAIGIGNMISQRQEKEQRLMSIVNLDYNEYTDGRIIFTKPDGFTCEKQELEVPKFIFFDLESEYCNVRIVSVYDTDFSIKNFNSYWENWKDDDLKDVPYKEILHEKRKVNDNPYYIKSVLYEMENPITWHFVMLSNALNKKVCVIHASQVGNDNQYLDELIKSIRL